MAPSKNKNADDDNEKETADWTNKREETCIDILYEHVKKGELQASTFKGKVWAEIGDELFAAVGKRFALDQLTGKFNRLRIAHREFSDLLEHTGFGWDPVSNTVTASPDV
ncbi:hypothetical protein M0R45_009724 [Rubus argutus]|uniref:Myb/SANT-like domain-containing protein n=1 Tax=Rubus argutus TaxID=59490 RepID=A0AAW1Y8C6_RUBAR